MNISVGFNLKSFNLNEIFPLLILKAQKRRSKFWKRQCDFFSMFKSRLTNECCKLIKKIKDDLKIVSNSSVLIVIKTVFYFTIYVFETSTILLMFYCSINGIDKSQCKQNKEQLLK